MRSRNASKGVMLMFICTLIATGVQYFAKTGVSLFTDSIISYFNIPILVSLSLCFILALCLTAALKQGNASALYPLISLSFIWTALVAYFIFEESLSIFQFAGFGLILVGSIILNSKEQIRGAVI